MCFFMFRDCAVYACDMYSIRVTQYGVSFYIYIVYVHIVVRGTQYSVVFLYSIGS